jgi:hypothetical protein
MDRIWQWAWDRYGARYLRALGAILIPIALSIYLIPSLAVVALERALAASFNRMQAGLAERQRLQVAPRVLRLATTANACRWCKTTTLADLVPCAHAVPTICPQSANGPVIACDVCDAIFAASRTFRLPDQGV